MLVLTRKVNEAIIIGGRITIKVIRIKGATIRLGIDAPADVTIFREEIADRPPKGPAKEAA